MSFCSATNIITAVDVTIAIAREPNGKIDVRMIDHQAMVIFTVTSMEVSKVEGLSTKTRSTLIPHPAIHEVICFILHNYRISEIL